MAKKSEAHSTRKTSVDWPPFAQKLAQVLATLEEDQYLVISVKRSNRFVQFAAQGSFGLRAETTSNAYLRTAEKLERKQLAALIKAGWKKPTDKPRRSTPERDPDGSPNYFAGFPAPVAFDEVAQLAVATFSGILRVAHPGMLEYKAFDRAGSSIALPELGLKIALGEANTLSPETRQKLALNLRETLRTITGIDDLDFDKDGDIGTRYGSMVTFARLIGDPPVVHLFSPLLTEVEASPGLYERLNVFNSRSQLMRFFWREQSIFAVADISAAPFTATNVTEVFKQFCRTADDMDDLLQAEFGGRMAFAEWIPSSVRH